MGRMWDNSGAYTLSHLSAIRAPSASRLGKAANACGVIGLVSSTYLAAVFGVRWTAGLFSTVAVFCFCLRSNMTMRPLSWPASSERRMFKRFSCSTACRVARSGRISLSAAMSGPLMRSHVAPSALQTSLAVVSVKPSSTAPLSQNRQTMSQSARSKAPPMNCTCFEPATTSTGMGSGLGLAMRQNMADCLEIQTIFEKTHFSSELRLTFFLR